MNRNTHVLLAGIGLIIVTNAIVLFGVAYNRSGTPDSIVELTERELALPPNYAFNKENTGIALTLKWRLEGETNTYYPSDYRDNPGWLNRQKLIELGFELPPGNDSPPERYHDANLSKDVFLVLQFDGDAYQRILLGARQRVEKARALAVNNPHHDEFIERTKRAREYLAQEQSANSRLFAVDAGLDKEALRQKYPDGHQYIILRALVRATWEHEATGYFWTGWITHLPVDRLNLPLEYRSALENAGVVLQGQSGEQSPRYKITVAFGKRAEPWIVSVSKL